VVTAVIQPPEQTVRQYEVFNGIPVKTARHAGGRPEGL